MKGSRKNKVFDTLDACPPKFEGKPSNSFIDITGQTFNYLTVLYRTGINSDRKALWVCKCNNCGKYTIVASNNLKSGHTKSCGCLISEKLRNNEIIGKTFNQLKVLKYDKSINERSYWVVECQLCGKIYSVCETALGKQYACGCTKSYKEEVIYNTLKNDGLHKDIQREVSFDDCTFKDKLKFDFSIPINTNPLIPISPIIKKIFSIYDTMLIEYDGEQHYTPVDFSGHDLSGSYKRFISCQIKDWIKDKYCIEKDIPLLRIKYTSKKQPTYDDIYKGNGYLVSKRHGNDLFIDVLDIIEQDFVNNGNGATFNIMAGISCTFKCCLKNPSICQNNEWANHTPVHMLIEDLIKRYNDQTISKSITFQGLEVFDNMKQLLWFINTFRKNHNDPIYIWTGYTKEECEDFIYLVQEKMHWENIYVKFGRFIPDQPHHTDPILGVELASPNQYAEKIS